MSYNDQLAQAIEFTKSLGAHVPDFKLESGSLLTQENAAAQLAALKKYGITDFKYSAGQCLKWSMALKKIISDAIHCEVLVTVGQLIHFGKPLFNPTQQQFKRWYNQGFAPDEFIANRGLNLHAWWTLPSGEILDFSLFSTLAMLENSPKHNGNVIGGWPDEIAPNPTYIPIVVGENAIFTIQNNTPFKFLASAINMSELGYSPIFVKGTQ